MFLCFLLEESWWNFCDTGGRSAFEAAALPKAQFSEWIMGCMYVFREECEVSPARQTLPNFWREAVALFGEFKLRMPVSSAFVVNADRTAVLLVKMVNNNRVWSLPGGKCYTIMGETDAECVFREVDEELGTGLARSMTLVDSRRFPPSSFSRVFSVFLLAAHTTAVKMNPCELVEWQWAPLERLDSLDVSEIVSRAFAEFRAAGHFTNRAYRRDDAYAASAPPPPPKPAAPATEPNACFFLDA